MSSAAVKCRATQALPENRGFQGVCSSPLLDFKNLGYRGLDLFRMQSLEFPLADSLRRR